MALGNTILVMTGLIIMKHYISYLFLLEPIQRRQLGLGFWNM